MPETRPPRTPTPDESATPTLCLLGGIDLRGASRAGADKLLGQQKVVALLAYLALAPEGRQQRRDRVVGFLWPELDQAHARGALRKAVHTIRDVLGKDAIVGRSDEDVMLDHAHLRCDAVEFANHVDAGRLQAGLDLFRGELMPGFHLKGCAEFGTWLDEHRVEVIERASAAAWAMAVRLEESKDYTMAGRMAALSVRFVWSNERVLRRAMLLLQRIGDRAGALRLYEDVALRLEKELETTPSPETEELLASIRKGITPA